MPFRLVGGQPAGRAIACPAKAAGRPAADRPAGGLSRRADLAVATLSVGWNYVEPDSARIDYYRRLWQASDEN
jgi:hypothetical protein